MTSQLPRTRIIPISDFYSRLQIEWLCYRFRGLIYTRPFDKKKFADICIKKREKIDQIALENCLPSIFNNVSQQERYLQKFFGKNGLPAFCYRDEYQEKIKGFWDVQYYFMTGTSVRFIGDSESDIEIGKIKECDVKARKVYIEIDNLIWVRSFEETTRIFPSIFYENFFKIE
jgi:hypothetical protein